MIKKNPKIKNNICLEIDPDGCAEHVETQVNYIKKQAALENCPKKVLVLGGSGGYGLATKIVAAFAGKADILSVSFEREPTERRPGSPGYYSNRKFDELAEEDGLKSITIEGDAFTDETKEEVSKVMKESFGKADMIVYSLAAPMRTDPKTGILHKSAIKPIGQDYESETIMLGKEDEIKIVHIAEATEEDIVNTVKVMGGEDWKLWIEYLLNEDLIEDNAVTVAFSYIGPEQTQAIYRTGALGKAKEHLENTAFELTELLKPVNGKAYVSVNKALVTRASSVIPAMPIYISALYNVMKEKGAHEDCIQQMYRLFAEKLYNNNNGVAVDEANRIRLDDWEMEPDVQEKVKEIMESMTAENFKEVLDLEGYKKDLYEIHGFAPED
jgi:enoyl-[acyl-carrier protein] reductase / trans-2-enoyl-CoA reductase (NAD+)